MKFKKIMIMLIMALFFISIAGVSAGDAEDAIAISEDAAAMEVAQSDEMTASDDSNVMEQSDDEELILEDNDVDEPMLGEGASTGSFTDLNDLINNQYGSNDTITLSCNYTFNGTDDDDSGFIHGIGINRAVTIDGRGCTIDGSQKARIFNIGDSGAVKFLNINFINGKATGSGWEVHGGAIIAVYRNCVVECCNFTNNTADGQGGALFRVTAYNCTFTGNTAELEGGAIIGGRAYNCVFTENTAKCYGGAISLGSAYNCVFTGNTAEFDGGAINSGDAYNCVFTGNTANEGGGAIFFGSAYNCTFTGNTARMGGAIGKGSAYNCTFTGNTAKNVGGAMMGNEYNPEEFSATLCMFDSNNPNDYSYIRIVIPVLSADDLTTSYKSGDRLLFNLTADNTNYTGFNTTIKIYQDEQEIGTYYALSGEGWIVDLNPGTYKAVLSLDKYEGVTNGTATITITDGTTFWDLNQTINGNANATITLDKNYSFNPAVDSDFINGIVINRNVTIDGNGYTLNGLKQARIFNVIGENVIFKNINFINGNAENGGAIYGGSVSINCNFTNNTAGSKEMTTSSMGYGGAICYGLAINCTFQNNNALQTSEGSIGDGNGGAIIGDAINCTFIGNHASWSGGAIYHGNADNCTFISNSAGFGGAINDGNAKICIFIQNKAYEYGDAMFRGTAILCIFDGNDYKTEIIPAYLNASNLTSTFNSGEKLPFNLTANNTNYYGFNITITIFKDGQPAGTYYALSGEDFPVNLTPGIYKVVLSLDRYEGVVNGEITLTINKANSTLTINNVTFDYGTSGSATVAFTNATGFVADVIGQPNAVVSVVNDTITVSGLDAGNYTLSVTTITDENHNNVTVNATITVNKAKVQLSANAVTTTYNVDKNLVITLKDGQGKALSGVKVTVNLNGAKTYTTDKNGQVVINVAKLVPKTYTAKVTFVGDNNYNASTADVKVTVKKAKPKLKAKKKTYKAKKKTKKFKITLKDNKGKAIKKAKVTIKIGKKTYKATTNSKGKATFKIKKLNKKGTFKATVTYKGNKYYNKATKKAKIKVIVTFKTVSKGSKDKSTVKEIQQALKNNGYYLTYDGHYLKIDGIYHGCTERSVKEFQHDKGLKVTGKVDEKTAKKLGILS